MVELIDGAIVTPADGIRNSADEAPDRFGAVKGDKLIRFVPSSYLSLHDSTLARSADYAIS